MAFFSLTFLSHIEHRDRRHLCEPACSGSCRHRDKRIVTAAGGNGVELVLPALEALFHLSLNVVPGYLLRFLLVETEADIFFDILSVGFLGIRRQDVLHARNRKTTVLLARRT